MGLDRIPQGLAAGVFLSVALGPFFFGAVERSVWIPLCVLWLGAGLLSILAERLTRVIESRALGSAVSRALMPVHALFGLQLIPLPKSFLNAAAPGSYAAHFLPDPQGLGFAPLSVSPSATLEAWLYVAGLQGLFLALLGLPAARRRPSAYALLVTIGAIAGEGLWQSRTAHPTWLYAQIPIMAPSGLETGGFGPYFNRNHFATLMALGAGWAAGLAGTLARERGGVFRLLSDTAATGKAILLSGAALVFVLASAASGSRSGAFAALCAVGVAAARCFPARFLLPPVVLGLAALGLSGASAIERLLRLDIVSTRLAPWLDMTNLLRFFPFFGVGLGAFAPAYWPYQMNATFEFWPHAHNEYLEWLIEGGLTGVVAVAVTLRSLRLAIQFRAGARLAVEGALIAFCVQALLDFPARIPANAAVLACMLALSAESRSRPAKGSEGRGR